MTDKPIPATAAKRLRSDAAANQTRLIEAARQVFAEQGVDAPMASVASAAGVGVATLSRRFTRRQLVEAVLEERLTDHLDKLNEALALPPAEGFDAYMESLCERRMHDQSLCHALTLRMPDSARVGALRASIREGQLELIDAGQAAGALRADLVPQDLVLTLEAVGGVMEATDGTAGWRRVFAMLMQSLTTTPAGAPLPAPPSPDELLETRTGPSRGRRTSPIAG